MHCKIGHICNHEVNGCIPVPPIMESSDDNWGAFESNCPFETAKIKIGDKTVCRKPCQPEGESNDCGIHQYCKNETIPQFSGHGFMSTMHLVSQSYCETPRCDENGQV